MSRTISLLKIPPLMLGAPPAHTVSDLEALPPEILHQLARQYLDIITWLQLTLMSKSVACVMVSSKLLDFSRSSYESRIPTDRLSRVQRYNLMQKSFMPVIISPLWYVTASKWNTTLHYSVFDFTFLWSSTRTALMGTAISDDEFKSQIVPYYESKKLLFTEGMAELMVSALRLLQDQAHAKLARSGFLTLKYSKAGQ